MNGRVVFTAEYVTCLGASLRTAWHWIQWNDNALETHLPLNELQPVSPHNVSLLSLPQLPWQKRIPCHIRQQSIPSVWGGVPMMMQWAGHLRQLATEREDNRFAWNVKYFKHCNWLSSVYAGKPQTNDPEIAHSPARVPSGCASPSLLPKISERTGRHLSAPKRSASDRPQGNPPKDQGELDI